MKKTKVLHVIGHLGKGGDSTAVLNIMNYIDENNEAYDFDFLTHNGYDENIVNNIQKKHKVFVLKNDARKMNPIKYYKEIKKILTKNNYDCVHFHTSFQSCIGLIAAKRAKVNIRVCHSHTSDTIRKTSSFSKKMILPVCRKLINIFATDKICCSKMSGEFLYGKNADFQVIYNGIDINKIKNIDGTKVKKIKEKYNIDDDTVVIGQVGRFDENKNQVFTLELAKKMENNKCLFFLIGDGELLEYIKKLSVDMKLKNVYFTNKIKNVNDFMYIFDFLLLPSKFGEGLPVTLIEQQIVNNHCICISSDIVTREANLGSVVYLNLNSVDDWVNVIKNPKTDMKECNYHEFDINVTAKKWLDLYNE